MKTPPNRTPSHITLIKIYPDYRAILTFATRSLEIMVANLFELIDTKPLARFPMDVVHWCRVQRDTATKKPET